MRCQANGTRAARASWPHVHRSLDDQPTMRQHVSRVGVAPSTGVGRHASAAAPSDLGLVWRQASPDGVRDLASAALDHVAADRVRGSSWSWWPAAGRGQAPTIVPMARCTCPTGPVMHGS